MDVRGRISLARWINSRNDAFIEPVSGSALRPNFQFGPEISKIISEDLIRRPGMGARKPAPERNPMSFTRVLRRTSRRTPASAPPRPAMAVANKPVRPILHLKPAS
jgi:hypothetical protein